MGTIIGQGAHTRRGATNLNIAELPKLLQKTSNHLEQNTGVQSGNEDDQ
jgi:hypothetical protein